jgi:ribonuclease P protein component
MQQRFRLTQGADFARVREQGTTYPHRLLSLTVAANHLPDNRYGFITSKRLGNAVTRNRARRLLREAVRQLHPQLNSGFDVVIVARRDIVGQHFLSVSRTVYELVRQAGLLRVEGELP